MSRAKRIAALSVAFIIGPMSFSNTRQDIDAGRIAHSFYHFTAFAVCCVFAAVALTSPGGTET